MENRTEEFTLQTVSSMEKVFADRAPSMDGARKSFTALRGETVSFQLAYSSTGMRKSRAQIQVKTLEGVQVRVRMVGLVPCAYPCHPQRDDDYLATTPGMYPDVLRDLDEYGFPVIAGQWRALWVDLEVSKEAKAGSYPVTFEISYKEHPGEVIAREQVRLEVIPAVLPESDIPHTEWFHSDCLANYYHVEVFSEEHWKIVENFIALAVKRACNMILTPIFTPPLDTAVGGERRTVQLIDVTVTDGGYKFGFEKLKRWVNMCLGCGVKYFEISHLFSQWGAVATPKIMATIDGRDEKLFGWDTKATGKEYTEFLQQMLPELLIELKALGVDEKCYFHISDEPQQEQMESYAAARNIVKDILKDYHMIDALSDYDFYKHGLVQEPVCANDHIEMFLKNRPEKLWTYYCTGQCVDVSNRFITQPGFRTRILGTQMYKYQIDGFLHWGYNFYNSEYSLYPLNPFECTDADGSFPSGDPFVVYPGADGKPLDSQRMMLMMEAFDDLRALTLMEKLTDRESVISVLDEAHVGEITFKKYPRSAEYIQNLRDRVNLEIAKAIG